MRKKPLQVLEKNDFANALEGWASPIELVYQNAKKTYLEQIEGHIMAKCEEVLGVKVDRDELIKAMNYDREQYKKGYQNGYEKRDKEIVRCKDCYYYTAGFLELKKASPLMSGYKVVGMCHTFNGLQSPTDDDFCSRGKRRETE